MTEPMDLPADDSQPSLIDLSEFEPQNTESPIFEQPNHRAGNNRRFFKRENSTKSKERTRKAAPKSAVPNRKGQFVEPITKLYMMGALALMPVDAQCAVALSKVAPQCATAWDEIAYKNEAVRRFLWGIIQTSAWGALLAAHLPLILAAMTHHNKAVHSAVEDNEWIQNIIKQVTTFESMDTNVS